MASNIDGTEFDVVQGIQTWNRFFLSLEDVFRLCELHVETDNSILIVTIIERLKTNHRTLTYLSERAGQVADGIYRTTSQTLVNLTTCIDNLIEVWEEKQIFIVASGDRCSTPAILNDLEEAETLSTGIPGRPAKVIDLDQIHFLLQMGFSKVTISSMFMIHRTTLWRILRREGYDLIQFSSIDDYELTEIISSIYQEHRRCGSSMMIGHLRSRGVVVQRYRVRNILRELDPANSALRWGMMVQRRVYSVPSPNSVWHIDGHHALVRWRFITHGGIDGYSRMIVYLRCSNNNRADTVAEAFLEAIARFSLPSRVRADHGTENNGVCEIMLERRGEGRGSFIAGRSVHNARIERLWRDVFYAVIQTYYNHFYAMENDGHLDVENELDMACLHYVYLPRINHALIEFVGAFNNHSIRTEGHWTPLQIWTNGTLRNLDILSRGIDVIEIDEHIYGIDPEAPVPTEEEYEVEVPENTHILTDAQKELLDQAFNPLSYSDYLGLDIYLSLHNYLNTLDTNILE